MIDSIPQIAYLGLGANLGEPVETLRQVKHLLEERDGVCVRKASSLYWTDPVGGPPGQPDYLNAALEVETELSPEHLLRLALAMEGDFGRVRGEHWAPRTLDIDILAYGELERRNPDLTLPHPGIHQRTFVLVPLVEIAPGWVHPTKGKTARELLDALPDRSGIRLCMEVW